VTSHDSSSFLWKHFVCRFLTSIIWVSLNRSADIIVPKVTVGVWSNLGKSTFVSATRSDMINSILLRVNRTWTLPPKIYGSGILTATSFVNFKIDYAELSFPLYSRKESSSSMTMTLIFIFRRSLKLFSRRGMIF